MIMKVEMLVELGILVVITTGEFSLQEAQRTFLEILDSVTRHKTGKVLFDGRELRGKPAVTERFSYGEFVAQAVAELTTRGVPRPLQFAYVLKEPVLDPGRFGETVAVNRGMLVKTFDNLEDAFGWLGKAPTDKTEAGDGQ